MHTPNELFSSRTAGAAQILVTALISTARDDVANKQGSEVVGIRHACMFEAFRTYTHDEYCLPQRQFKDRLEANGRSKQLSLVKIMFTAKHQLFITGYLPHSYT